MSSVGVEGVERVVTGFPRKDFEADLIDDLMGTKNDEGGLPTESTFSGVVSSYNSPLSKLRLH